MTRLEQGLDVNLLPMMLRRLGNAERTRSGFHMWSTFLSALFFIVAAIAILFTPSVAHGTSMHIEAQDEYRAACRVHNTNRSLSEVFSDVFSMVAEEPKMCSKKGDGVHRYGAFGTDRVNSFPAKTSPSES